MWTRHHSFAVALCLIAFASASAISDFVFERVPHVEDELAYYFQAQVFAHGRAYVNTPPEPVCFFAPFVLDYQGHRFGKYPPGWSALLALGLSLRQTWWIPAMCFALTLALIFRLGADVGGRGIGALASALAITSPYALLLSGTLMSHAGSLLFATAFFVLWRRRLACIGSFATGALLGCAFAIRPFSAIAIAIPAGFVTAIQLWRQRDWQRVVLMFAGFTIPASSVFFFNAIWTGDPFASTYELYWRFDKLGFGPGFGMREGGHTLWFGLGMAGTLLGELATRLHGVPALSLTFVIVGFLFKPRRASDLFLGATALALILAHVVYWTDGSLFKPRYFYEATFAFFILSALGIARVDRWMQHRGAYRGALALALCFDLFVFLPFEFREYNALYEITARPRAILQDAQLHNALVIVHGDLGWKDYAVPFTLNAPTLDGDVVYANDCGALNQKLIAHFLGRRVYFFDARTMMVNREP
ncbi:MAG: hypothetical protein HZC40_02160 [Chloroflexi bacterium]|nr:hypothetical protein [Chloroflexota bacterium]